MSCCHGQRHPWLRVSRGHLESVGDEEGEGREGAASPWEGDALLGPFS